MLLLLLLLFLWHLTPLVLQTAAPHIPTGMPTHLKVIVRVPIGVVDDDGVRRGQVDAQPAGSRGQQEAEVLVREAVEAVNALLPLRATWPAHVAGGGAECQQQGLRWPNPYLLAWH